MSAPLKAGAITASAVGREVGVSADTVRRHWKHWHDTNGFPRPLFDGGLLRWDADVLAQWKHNRSTHRGAGPVPLEPDWAGIARKRGQAIDEGRDPDSVSI